MSDEFCEHGLSLPHVDDNFLSGDRVECPGPTPDEPCQHESQSGDEGPVRDLPGRDPVRWCCDGCGAITYDDHSLAKLRAALSAAEARVETLQRQRDDLMGTGEVAKALGVTKQRVHQLMRERKMPQPIARLEMGPVWSASEIRDYAPTRRRTPGPLPHALAAAVPGKPQPTEEDR